MWRRLIIRLLYPEIFELFKKIAQLEKHELNIESQLKGLMQSGYHKDQVIKRLGQENRGYRELSERDPKTRLLNMRGLENQLLSAFDIARRSKMKQPITTAFVIIDLDNFKRVNDEIGHDHGDTALLVITELLQLCFPRKTNLKCRWGGDEFVVIMIDNNEGYATASAERFRKDVESDPRLLFNSNEDLPSIRVTASIGITTRAITIEEHGILDTILSAEIGRTDAALREAKRSGKNQVRLMKNDI
jgi:diguanylate cyclase (GGDEF)-like protein